MKSIKFCCLRIFSKCYLKSQEERRGGRGGDRREGEGRSILLLILVCSVGRTDVGNSNHSPLGQRIDKQKNVEAASGFL
jgi:hypothetical protein